MFPNSNNASQAAVVIDRTPFGMASLSLVEFEYKAMGQVEERYMRRQYKSLSVDELFERHREGDDHALAEFFNRKDYRNQFIRYARVLIPPEKNMENAEDVVQYAFEKVSKIADKSKISVAYIRKVIINHCIDIMRCKRRITASVDAPIDGAEGVSRIQTIPDQSSLSPEQFADESALIEAYLHCKHLQGNEMQKILSLKIEHGMQEEEAAEEMSMSKSTYNRKKRRAIFRLAQCFKRNNYIVLAERMDKILRKREAAKKKKALERGENE